MEPIPLTSPATAEPVPVTYGAVPVPVVAATAQTPDAPAASAVEAVPDHWEQALTLGTNLYGLGVVLLVVTCVLAGVVTFQTLVQHWRP